MKYCEEIELLKSNRIQQIIEKGKSIFSTESISDMTMVDIADRCEIGVASLYRYFGTKKNFVITVAGSLWDQMRDEMKEKLFTEEYENLTGIEQIRVNLERYLYLFEYQKGFLMFIQEFDQYVIREHISTEELMDYQNHIVEFWEEYMNAVEKGKRDHTIKEDLDYNLIYLTMSHTLLSLAQKLLSPIIIERDKSNNSYLEMETIIKMAIESMKV